jgi:hypothetical protein
MMTWSPHDEHGSCFMGKKYSYQRRREGDECYYGQSFDFAKTLSSEACACTQYDYEWYDFFNCSIVFCFLIFSSACFLMDKLTGNCTSVCLTAGMKTERPDICAASTPTKPIYYDEDVGYAKRLSNFDCEHLSARGKSFTC